MHARAEERRHGLFDTRNQSGVLGKQSSVHRRRIPRKSEDLTPTTVGISLEQLAGARASHALYQQANCQVYVLLEFGYVK